MANDVFANNREISCKAGSGKSICAFPDVCFTPPENPATPPGVPIPYPNTGMASDTTNGSKKVKISGKEVMLKNKSYFKKSMGDEAGCAAKKGIVSSANRGKVYYVAWSMDVKIEGENAVRHFDLTTHNHASPLTNTGPWLFVDTAAIIMGGDPCEAEKRREKMACEGIDNNLLCASAGLNEDPQPAGMTGRSDVRLGQVQLYGPDGRPAYLEKRGPRPEGQRDESRAQMEAWRRAQANDCLATTRCRLSPKNPKTCCPGQTPHHLIEDEYAKTVRSPNYAYDDAPCICAEGNSWGKGSHGMLHAVSKQAIIDHTGDRYPATLNYGTARAQAANAVTQVFPDSCCSEECIQSQLDAYYKKRCNFDDSTPMNVAGRPSGRGDDQRAAQLAWNQARQRTMQAQRAARLARLGG